MPEKTTGSRIGRQEGLDLLPQGDIAATGLLQESLAFCRAIDSQRLSKDLFRPVS